MVLGQNVASTPQYSWGGGRGHGDMNMMKGGDWVGYMSPPPMLSNHSPPVPVPK